MKGSGQDRAEQVCFMNMCMVQDAEGNVLALDKVNDSYTGTTFPGGHVEKGETFAESVIREVREETGLLIENPYLCGIYHWMCADVRCVVLLYKTACFSGTLRSSEEGRVYWTSLEEFRGKDLAEGMESVLELMASSEKSECRMSREGEKWVETLY